MSSWLLHKCAKCGCELRAEDDPQSVITVRLPKSLHDSLKSAAHDRETSLNSLCVELLGQFRDAAATGELTHA